MEIPEDIQNKLKCSECYEMLSCGPVYLLHETGGAICGRCSQESDTPESKTDTAEISKTRYGQYETAASFLKFPCAFASRGCPKKLPFTLGTQPHEANCEYRPMVCPMAPQHSCNWIGTLSRLKEHCDAEHPANVLENPCNPPRPDLTQSNIQTYLISAFRFLFLLQVKVCVTSGKLFHSVRMFGDSKLVEKFLFHLEVEGNDMKIEKVGRVLRAGIPAIQESTEVCTLIKKLLVMLHEKYDECKFTITILTSIDDNMCAENNELVPNIKSVPFEEQLVKCKFSDEGCLFADVNKEKCEKHETYFCKFQTKCCLNGCTIMVGSFIDHLDSSTCSNYVYKSYLNTFCRISKNSHRSYILLQSGNNNIGTILCSYSYGSKIKLNVMTSMPWHELKNYNCAINFGNKFSYDIYIPNSGLHYESKFDWIFELNSVSDLFEISIKIERKKLSRS